VALVFCYLLVVKIALVYWRQGLFPRWRLADLYWSFGFYLDVLVVVAVGLCAPLLVLPAWVAAWRPRAAAVPPRDVL
jgi:hypothetical protein